MHKAKGEDQGMQKDPDKEGDTSASLVDHPMPPLFAQTIRFVGGPDGGSSVGPLETLQPSAFGLVPLQVASTRLNGIVVCHIRVLFYVRHFAI